MTAATLPLRGLAAREPVTLDELNRTADEFAVLATQGVDPATGQAFTDPERLRPGRTTAHT